MSESIKVYPFFTVDHFEVHFRADEFVVHKGSSTEVVELTADEADRFADDLKAAAVEVRRLNAKEKTESAT